MKTVNLHEAKTHLSRLIRAAADGESFIIAEAGKPLVKVTAFEPPESTTPKPIGFMVGQIQVRDDFDTMGADEIAKLFSVSS